MLIGKKIGKIEVFFTFKNQFDLGMSAKIKIKFTLSLLLPHQSTKKLL